MRRKERVTLLICSTWLGLMASVVGTTPPQDCADLFATGTRQSGTYTVGEPSPYQVYCDMSFLGGGWTVLQHRQEGSVDFAKTWEEYQQGFGDLGGEFWLGLDKIHTLTTAKSYILEIELEDFNGERRYARYGTFSVGDSSGNYEVTIAGYTGDAGDSLTNTGNNGRNNINGHMFSTNDRDNDANSAHCSSLFSQGGWWYPTSCGQSLLNGRYNCHLSSVTCGSLQGVIWSTWGGTSYFLKKTTIMIRPADFTGSDTPQDCADLYEDGIIESGINAVSDPRIFVYCDMRNHGGGWTLLQRRQDGSVDFAKSWAAYQEGFGNLDGEHWLGQSKQNQITGQKAYSLRVDLGDWENQFRYATYSSFSVGGSSTNYRVSISGYSGDAGDSLTSGGSRFSINGIAFTTSDQNNGQNTANCASNLGGGGWWYPQSCGYALINGRYNGSGNAQGVHWQQWRGYSYSLKTSSLKVRPDNFQVCADGMFGSTCTETCHCLNGNAYCNHVTGACLGGCAEGWDGSDCQTERPDSPTSSTSVRQATSATSDTFTSSQYIPPQQTEAMVVHGQGVVTWAVPVSIMAAVLVVSIGANVFLIIKRRRAAKEPTTPTHAHGMVEPGISDDNYDMVDTQDSRSPARSPRAPATVPLSLGVSGTRSDSDYQALDPKTMCSTEYTSLNHVHTRVDNHDPVYVNDPEYLELF